MKKQLILGVQLRDTATFDNFYAGDNTELISYLQRFVLGTAEKLIYLYGNYSSGRSHLLQACCHAIGAQNLSAVFLPLTNYTTLSPQIFEGLETLTLVGIDDVDAIAGQAEWEEALFHCYNRLQHAGARLIITGRVPPAQLKIKLPDLKSRLGAAVVFQIKSLTDEQKIIALQLRAKRRGMVLTQEVANFLLHHYARDNSALFTALDKLDEASLIEQKKLTIPFAKKVLA